MRTEAQGVFHVEFDGDSPVHLNSPCGHHGAALSTSERTISNPKLSSMASVLSISLTLRNN